MILAVPVLGAPLGVRVEVEAGRTRITTQTTTTRTPIMIHAYIQEPPGDQTPLRPTGPRGPHGYLREVCHEPLQVTRMVAAIAE